MEPGEPGTGKGEQFGDVGGGASGCHGIRKIADWAQGELGRRRLMASSFVESEVAKLMLGASALLEDIATMETDKQEKVLAVGESWRTQLGAWGNSLYLRPC